MATKANGQNDSMSTFEIDGGSNLANANLDVIAVAFSSIRLHAIFGTGRWESVTIEQAAKLLEELGENEAPIFVLDRDSVNEIILDVDIIDLRVHLMLAAVARRPAALAFGQNALRIGLVPAFG